MADLNRNELMVLQACLCLVRSHGRVRLDLDCMLEDADSSPATEDDLDALNAKLNRLVFASGTQEVSRG